MSDKNAAPKAPWYATYFGFHYLAIYSSHLLRPMETGWEAEFIGTQLRLKAGAKVLDVPCGFGRHLLRLARAGFRPFGLDLQFPYLLYARQLTADPALPPIPTTQGDMSRLPFTAASFDALACLFNSFGYFPDEPREAAGGATNRGVLAEFARVLKPGGKILLDVPDREALKEAIEFKDRTHCAGEDWEIIERWSFDEKTNRVHNETRFVLNGQPHDTGYDMRLYVREELEEELRRAGLAPWRFWNDLHRDAGDSPGERLVIAAIKDN